MKHWELVVRLRIAAADGHLPKHYIGLLLASAAAIEALDPKPVNRGPSHDHPR